MSESANGWAVVSRGGYMILPAMKYRVDAIKYFVGPEGDWKSRWSWWRRKHGATCQKVTVTRSNP